MIFSSSNYYSYNIYENPYYIFIKYLLILISGFISSIVIILIPTKIYKKVAFLGILGCLGVLIGLFLMGEATNSAVSWFYVLGIQIQPSEFSKLIIIIYLGSYYMVNLENAKKDINKLIQPLLFCGAIFFMVMIQPDFGTGFIIFSITFFTFAVLPINTEIYKLIMKISGIVIVLTIFLMVSGILDGMLSDTQKDRFNFKNPCDRYTESTGYQLCNGFIAINNGGLFGVGLGNSTQKYSYLPAPHNDFIYTIIIEELGLVSGVILMIVYILVLSRLYRISKNALNLQNSIIPFGVLMLILSHICINLGGVLGLIPMTGIPLPFMSYGGSFTLMLMMSLAVVQRIVIETKIKKETENA